MRPLRIVSCYTRQDKKLRDKLNRHLGAMKRSGQITTWYNREVLLREIVPRTEQTEEFDKYLSTSDIVLLLISPDFIDSGYCHGMEMSKILEKQQKGDIYVIPVILRPVDWAETPISKLQALPYNGKPLTSWANQDAAFMDVVAGIKQAVVILRSAPENALEKESDASILKDQTKVLDPQISIARFSKLHHISGGGLGYEALLKNDSDEEIFVEAIEFSGVVAYPRAGGGSLERSGKIE